MNSLSKYLKSNQIGFTIAPCYASSRESIASHASAFRELVENLPCNPTIDIVGHSLGNIVVRHAIADWQSMGDSQDVIERMKHMVMLGPPNQSAAIAVQLARTGLFGVIAGQSGLELGRDRVNLQHRLAKPPFPFAIVAGNLSSSMISNPLIDRASDFVVSVNETELEGAAIKIEVPVMHSFLMDDKKVHAFIADFLTR